MPVYATDIILKTAIEAGIADLRKNRYILEDCFMGLADDALSAPEFGWKEVASAIRWFDAADIRVIQNFRIDTPVFPSISISAMSSTEALESAMLADEASDTKIRATKVTGVRGPHKNPVRITKNFTPVAYDSVTGIVTLPPGITTEIVSVGQYYISTKNAMAYPIMEIVGADSFAIEAGHAADFFDSYIAPTSIMWQQHSGITFLNEEYQIGAHVTSDPVHAVWLFQVLFYTLLRVKESLIEGRGFELSTMSAGPIIREEGIKSDFIFTRNVTLRGKMPATFVKFVAPPIEKVSGGLLIADAPATPPSSQEQVLGQGWKPGGDDV